MNNEIQTDIAFMINVPIPEGLSPELQAMYACEFVLLHLLPRKIHDDSPDLSVSIERKGDSAARARVTGWLFRKYYGPNIER